MQIFFNHLHSNKGSIKTSKVTWIVTVFIICVCSFALLLTACQNAVNNASLSHNDVIPEGGTYYVGVIETSIGDYSTATRVYNEGDSFPEITCSNDVYVFGDYEYRYNEAYTMNNSWTSSAIDGWGAIIIDNTKTSYGEILKEINKSPVKSLNYTFSDCAELTEPPAIPSSVISMRCTFLHCKSLTQAPDLSNCAALTHMSATFYGCEKLTAPPVIPENVNNMNQTFSDCTALTESPDLSKCTTLIDMGYTFYKCESLTTPPVVPETVNNMTQTFAGCTSLTQAPDVSKCKNLVDMECTFCDCTSLITPPLVIPENATNMEQTFYNCLSLGGTITINSPNIENADFIFYTKKSITVKVPTNSTSYTTITEACKDCSYVTIVAT